MFWYDERMPLILISGISTSGKSTIRKELSKLGYEAYDTEHNGISAWFNKKTSERAAEFGEISHKPIGWLDEHEWRISVEWVRNIALKAKDAPIFLCGGASNIADVISFCSVVIWLQTDEVTIRKRVNNPRDHDYGTRPHELSKIIRENKLQEADYRSFDAKMVDATQDLADVMRGVLKIMPS